MTENNLLRHRPSGRVSILFVTTGLQTGGAERMLVKLLKFIDRTRFDPYVISLIDKGTMGAQIEAHGIPVSALHINTIPGLVCAPWRLAALIRRGQFSLIQGWMYHGNLSAWAGRLLAGSRAMLSFGIRHTLYDLMGEHRNTRWVIRANAFVSRFTSSCLFNSQVSVERHRLFGFKSPVMQVIPNGFEIDTFAPDPAGAQSLRTQLGLGDSLVVGLVARFDPAKDHHTFLKAAARVRAERPDTRFVLVGRNVDWDNSQLVSWVRRLGLEESVLLLGERSDISALNSLFDVACLSSHMEAFPNVVGEAMACGTPCAVTDVGDCRAIVGDTGRVAAPRDADALAAAVEQLLQLHGDEREALGRQARARIVANFEITSVVANYMSHYAKLLDPQPTVARPADG